MFNIKHLISVLFALYAMSCHGKGIDTVFYYPFYVGMIGGYGATTWNGLVPAEKNQNNAISLSAPLSTTEGGFLWGAFAGVELNPFFAIEATFQRYPNAKITFDETSLFSFDHDGRTGLTTHTELLSLSAKVMTLLPRTLIRVYSSVGAGGIHRSDIVSDRWRVSPTFGAGVNFSITPHWMAEIGGVYTAGDGQAELTPVNDYVPFLYAVFLRIAYRFNPCG